ncbi:PREDICTED: kelch domain-containing protein 3-like isoform X1 [Branchiostoma belcheri]|uniref:Kelch domain-containing protein 3-like isoform X1 n=2 Tax=Branchiostoma belcheri TaxID=7741 RepID=A0A6P4YN90_BRABE|nr:PREDICTED: kelch domain-containing protein 3-like isoform X1 [Branchiostoma belcheri]
MRCSSRFYTYRMHWIVHLEGGPRRVNHAAVSVGDKVYSFGGYCTGEDFETTRPIDVHVFHIVTCRWKKLPIPTHSDPDYQSVPYMRYGHTAVAVGEKVYLFGGRNDSEGADNILYCFDTTTLRWSCPQVTGATPPARDGHSLCVVDDNLYVFGGYEQIADCFSNEVHKLDTTTMHWRLLPARGHPARWRDFHSATAVGSKMLIFGGRADQLGPYHSNHEIYPNYVKVFDTVTLRWSEPEVKNRAMIEGRRSHSAFAHGQYVYIFGGYNALLEKHYGDMWRLDTEKWEWKQVFPLNPGPCARRRQCACVIRDQVVLFGGTSPCEFGQVGDLSNLMDHSDVYILDLAPSLKTLCKVAVIKHKLDWSVLPYDIRWELEAMTKNNTISRPLPTFQG